MKNFIFKSQETYKKLFFKLETIQTELRYQRSEHGIIIRQLNLLLNQKQIEDQASAYYKKYGEDEASPQTDPEEHDNNHGN